jgi:hypothetical protein
MDFDGSQAFFGFCVFFACAVVNGANQSFRIILLGHGDIFYERERSAVKDDE